MTTLFLSLLSLRLYSASLLSSVDFGNAHFLAEDDCNVSINTPEDTALTWAGRMGWLQEAHFGAKTLL